MITGAELAAKPVPSRFLGIVARPTVSLVADELVQRIGEAIGDFTIPPEGVRSLAHAVAVMTVSDPDDGIPASAIAEEGKQRLSSPEVTTERERLCAHLGPTEAEAAICDCVNLGTTIFEALGERRVPNVARNMLAVAASHVIEQKWGL